jgi:hypothetical protein
MQVQQEEVLDRRKLIGGIAAGVLALGVGAGAASADETGVAAAGNGGVAVSDASGGVVVFDSYLDTSGYIVSFTLSADGGGSLSDASGGDENVAVVD